MENLRQKKLFIFDMDNCLYKDVGKSFERKIYGAFYEMVEEHYGISRQEVKTLDQKLMAEYGHYLKGWYSAYPDFPFNKWFDVLMDKIDLTSVAFASTLPFWINQLPGKKVILTNAHTGHAEHLLAHMKLEECFDAIYTVDEHDLHSNLYKPHPDIYTKIMNDFSVKASETAMFEDSKTNLKTAHDLGISTVLVNQEKQDDDHHVHHDYETIDHFFEEFYAR